MHFLLLVALEHHFKFYSTISWALKAPSLNSPALDVLTNAEIGWADRRTEDLRLILGAKNRLINAFLSTGHRLYLPDKIMRTRQADEESITAYIAQMRYWCGLYNAEMPEEDILDHIIDGLKPEIARQVMLSRPANLAELNETASLVEQTLQRFEQMTSSLPLVNLRQPEVIKKMSMEQEISRNKWRTCRSKETKIHHGTFRTIPISAWSDATTTSTTTVYPR